MGERKIRLALYHNPTGSAVEVSIVERVGAPPDVYRVEAGGVVEGPANYADTFANHRLVPVTKERLVEIETAAKAKAKAIADKAAADEKAKADAKVKAELFAEPAPKPEPEKAEKPKSDWKRKGG